MDLKELKPGQKVRCFQRTNGHTCFEIGEEGMVQWSMDFYITHLDGTNPCNNMEDFELISSHESNKVVKTIMSLKEKFILGLTKEPNKTFRKLNITNGDDMLTEEGKELYLNWKFQQDQAAFKTEVADGLLADIKEEK